MKKIISLFLVIALLLSSIGITSKKEVYGAETESKMKYHLDMGVYVVAYVAGKWTNNISYGTSQPYTANLTFNDAIKVKRVMTIDQAEIEGINIWDSTLCSNNIPKGTRDTVRDEYDYIYADHTSPSITNIQIASDEGTNIKYSYNALLSAKNEDYDLIKKYEDKRRPIPIVRSVVVKNNSLVETIKDLEEEKAALWKNISSGVATITQMRDYERYQAICKQLIALYAKPTETTVEKIITAYERDVKGFVDEVFKFWGGEQGLYKENRSLYTLIKNMSEMEDVNEDDKFYLVFLPTVIEYEEAGPIEDPAPPILVPDTSGSCKDRITWSETKSHTYTTGSGENTVTHTCYHHYYYEATLTSTAKLTADKPNGAPLAFKSGYGFSVTMNNTVSVRQFDDNGSCGDHKNKPYTKTITAPTDAEVRTNWKVPNTLNNKTQPSTVALRRSSGSSLASSFVTAPNPVSNYNKALIYTDVKLAGTKQKPVIHTVTAYTYGGGVNGVQFCNSIPLQFSINGDMFEDDSTADRKI